jgi:hypothetical protein
MQCGYVTDSARSCALCRRTIKHVGSLLHFAQRYVLGPVFETELELCLQAASYSGRAPSRPKPLISRPPPHRRSTPSSAKPSSRAAPPKKNTKRMATPSNGRSSTTSSSSLSYVARPTGPLFRLDPPPQVAYQRILQLTYVDDLLTAMKALFIKLFEPFLATFVASLHAMNSGGQAPSTAREPSSWNFAKAFEGWDKVFDKLLKGIEDKAVQVTVADTALVYYSCVV